MEETPKTRPPMAKMHRQPSTSARSCTELHDLVASMSGVGDPFLEAVAQRGHNVFRSERRSPRGAGPQSRRERDDDELGVATRNHVEHVLTTSGLRRR